MSQVNSDDVDCTDQEFDRVKLYENAGQSSIESMFAAHLDDQPPVAGQLSDLASQRSDLASQRYILFRANIATDLVKVVIAAKPQTAQRQNTPAPGGLARRQSAAAWPSATAYFSTRQRPTPSGLVRAAD
ncbi:MAG: hypothetical protein M1826_001660 [Phylliscum demangeonii]|nr:MAG: hypothetical protein M1826_001660 [Phylliscum demangeonii]